MTTPAGAAGPESQLSSVNNWTSPSLPPHLAARLACLISLTGWSNGDQRRDPPTPQTGMTNSGLRIPDVGSDKSEFPKLCCGLGEAREPVYMLNEGPSRP